jgi:acyl-coenzyme A thioesterase PaaI-like protein
MRNPELSPTTIQVKHDETCWLDRTADPERRGWGRRARIMTNGTGENTGPSDDFLAHWNAVLGAGDDMALTLGLEPLFGDPSGVTLRMALKPAIRQPAGMFSAAALFGLADVSGTTLARYHAPPEMFPLAVQSSISLVGNTSKGFATSRSKLVNAGRRLIVTTTSVFDDAGRLLTKVETTYLPAAPRVPPPA